MDRTFSDASRADLRQRELVGLGRFYSPWVHLLCPSGLALCVMGWALATLDRVEGWEWAVPLVTYVIANAAEWRIHRDLLHNKSPAFRWLYERHTIMHHRVYVEWDMPIRSVREAGLVMIPPMAQVLLVVLAIGMALLVRALGNPDAARLFLATEIAYVVSYEWLHLLFHLPTGGPLGRVVAFLRRHHAAHHHPARMSTTNFNVTVPLWDHVRRTVSDREYPVPDHE